MTEAAIQPVERRGAARVPVSFHVPLGRAGTEELPAAAINISASGMLVRSEREVPIWSRLTAVLPELGARDVRVVRRDGRDYGCLFQTPLEDEELDAVLASEDAMVGFERLRVEAEAPPPPPRRGLLRLWKR